MADIEVSKKLFDAWKGTASSVRDAAEGIVDPPAGNFGDLATHISSVHGTWSGLLDDISENGNALINHIGEAWGRFEEADS